MEQKQLSLEALAKRLYNLEVEVIKLKQQKEEVDWVLSSEDITLISQDSLSKEWLTSEEDEAWKDL